MSEEINKINKLLSEVRKYTIQQKEISRKSGEDFNVFKLCGVYHYENSHSDIIAEFLNPKGSHDCGNDFLLTFCRIVGLDRNIYQQADIRREYFLGDNFGRIDILIQARKNMIIIENKIYAGEREDQLKKYREWLDKKKPTQETDAKLLFLTLDGRKSVKFTGEYSRISYKDHIIPWLTECIRLAAEKPFVRESLIQYRTLVEDLTKGEIMTIDQELFDAITRNFKSAIEVRNEVDHVKAAWLWDNILEPLLAKDSNFTVDRPREEMIATNDVFLSYEDKVKQKKVLYAFNSYGFKKPRQEVITKDESGKETIQKSQRNDLPHNWDDGFFSKITPENTKEMAQAVIESIIRDKDNVLI